MEQNEPSSRSHLKRPYSDEDDLDSDQAPREMKPRFPKGKKVKKGDGASISNGVGEDGAGELTDPRVAAKERARRRGQITIHEERQGVLEDITGAEEQYEDDTNFVDDGIEFEPFNLKNERQEGYFDSEGNFVEYLQKNEKKDAWLDAIDADGRFAEKDFKKPIAEMEDQEELSPGDIGMMKRRIADLLEPGETVLHALRRLKGISSDKKEKMPEETKLMFDQLTEDSMKLMENGDYNVYHDKKETFQREAEGYERLACARKGISISDSDDIIGPPVGVDASSNGLEPGVGSSLFTDMASGSLNVDTSTTQAPSSSGYGGGDAFDMFGEDDELDKSNLNSEVGGLVSSSQSTEAESSYPSQSGTSGDTEMDYVYDESSGYYYSSNLGYYYDPASGLFCSATSGIWYLYNEQTGAYDEVQEAAAPSAAS